MRILLWAKWSHQRPNFESFKCSGENLSIFSCYFPNHMSVFLQILHHSSESWKITPLYFLGQKLLCTKGTNQSASFWDFQVLGSKYTKCLSFLKQQISFSSKFASLFSVICWNFMWAVESLKFCTLMGSFCRNHVQFQQKNTEELSVMILKNDA